MNAEDEATYETINHAFMELRAKEAFILHERFWNGRTLKDVGTDLGVTRETVRQIQNNALRKVAKVLIRRWGHGAAIRLPVAGCWIKRVGRWGHLIPELTTLITYER